jgi:catechol 2,3-dioxygenase-like lactoylglutathione lyase family enzyme
MKATIETKNDDMNLNQITILATDVSTSVAFYKKLGLLLIVDATPKYARFQCSKGSSTFSIHYTGNISEKSNITLYFEDENLDDTVTHLQRKGIIFQTLPEDKPWLWREASLHDPDGHQLIIYFAGENRLNPPWRIN